MKTLITVCTAGALLFSSSKTDVPPAPKAAAGSVSGKAILEGERPAPKPDFTPKEEEMKGCHHEEGAKMDLSDQSLLVDAAGGVANVVVMIDVEGADVKPRTEPVSMDQKGCRFEPHVLVVRAGESVRFENSDETNHNIHTYAKKNNNINNNVAGGSHYDMKIEKEEQIKVGCDIHTWMGSYVIATDASHFAVSGPDGSFEIKDLPAGTYKAEYWHETLGKGKAEVVVEEGKAATLEIKLSAEKKGGRGK